MRLMTSIVNGELMRLVRRHSAILTVDLTTSIGIVYLWNRGYRNLTSAVSLCCIGGTYLYRYIKSRDKVYSNQAVIVTGCDSGLGYSLALHCRRLGATVIAGVLNYDGPGAKNLEKEDILVYPLDVTRTGSVQDFASSVRTLLRERNLALRCLVNNAAVMIFGEFEWQTDEQLRSQVEVNFLGTMRVTRELMPMIRAHSSRIIVISSHCNIQPIPGVAAYSGTKAAITAWSTALRIELKKYGVRVVSFVPGSFVGESKILARQAEHFEAMRKSMSEEANIFYGDYFTRYAQYFSAVGQDTKLEKLQDPGIYDVFEGALLDRHPRAVYKRESWRYFIYHALFMITPTCVCDRLVQRFVQGPSWSTRIKTSCPFEGTTAGTSSSNILKGDVDSSATEKQMKGGLSNSDDVIGLGRRTQ